MTRFRRRKAVAIATGTTSCARSRRGRGRHMVKMCMQCGVCAGSCPLGPHWGAPPQKLFMMIRAGKREEVLASDSMDVHQLLQLHRPLPAQAADHPPSCTAWPTTRAPPRLAPKAADARLSPPSGTTRKTGRVNELKFTLATTSQDGLSGRASRRRWRCGHRPGHVQGGPAQPDGDVRRPRLQGPKGIRRSSPRRRSKSRTAKGAKAGLRRTRRQAWQRRNTRSTRAARRSSRRRPRTTWCRRTRCARRSTSSSPRSPTGTAAAPRSAIARAASAALATRATSPQAETHLPGRTSSPPAPPAGSTPARPRSASTPRHA